MHFGVAFAPPQFGCIPLTQWKWIWVNSGGWWWTGKSGVLWSMGSQEVRQNWATELNWSELIYIIYAQIYAYMYVYIHTYSCKHTHIEIQKVKMRRKWISIIIAEIVTGNIGYTILKYQKIETIMFLLDQMILIIISIFYFIFLN